MKFTVQKDVLLSSLQSVQSVVEKKNTVQILSNVLFEVSDNILSLTATDLEVGIKLNIPIDSAESGKVALSAKNILDIVKELPNKPIHFNKKENHWVEISCQKSHFKIVGLNADEFPPLPNFENKNYIKTSTQTTKEMIDKTSFAVSTDETRYHLNGSYLESIENNIVRMVSTDGHRLAFIDREMFLNNNDLLKKSVIIPKKGLAELRRLLEIKSDQFEMCVDKSNLLFKIGDTSLFVRLIEGNFPPYEQVIPKNNDKKITLDRIELIGCLKRASLLAFEKTKQVKFSFTDKVLTITAKDAELGEAKEEMDADYAGEMLDIGFNAKYLIDCLSILNTEKVTLELKDKLNPGILKPVGHNGYTYVVMPMKI